MRHQARRDALRGTRSLTGGWRDAKGPCRSTRVSSASPHGGLANDAAASPPVLAAAYRVTPVRVARAHTHIRTCPRRPRALRVAATLTRAAGRLASPRPASPRLASPPRVPDRARIIGRAGRASDPALRPPRCRAARALCGRDATRGRATTLGAHGLESLASAIR